MFAKTPLEFFILETSNKGFSKAFDIAFSILFSPFPIPIPKCALPLDKAIIVRTSAKSTFTPKPV